MEPLQRGAGTLPKFSITRDLQAQLLPRFKILLCPPLLKSTSQHGSFGRDAFCEGRMCRQSPAIFCHGDFLSLRPKSA
jgi:hypothetical protein